ncbi:hypothetical protein NSQ26_12570 [Bacillus sp. FSL W7-1360]
MKTVLQLVAAEFRMTSIWHYVLTVLFAAVSGGVAVVAYGVDDSNGFVNFVLFYIFIWGPLFLVRKHSAYVFAGSGNMKRIGLLIWDIYRLFPLKVTMLCWSRIVSQMCSMVLFFTVGLVVMVIGMSWFDLPFPDVSLISLILSWLLLNGMWMLWHVMYEPVMVYSKREQIQTSLIILSMVIILLVLVWKKNIWFFETLFYSVKYYPIGTPLVLALLFTIVLLITPRRMRLELERRDASV